MKFRTEIDIRPFSRKIEHSQRGFSVGSCFAESIAGQLSRAKFPIVSNPTGVLYNPFSIADALEEFAEGRSTDENTKALSEADYVLVTFGTAWVFEEGGRVVANCGKRPAHLFTRRRLSVEEIARRFDRLLGRTDMRANDGTADATNGPTEGGILAGKQIIFTVSPVRHLKDGFEENSLSKAILRLAIARIVERHPDAMYFPAYEILNDDLRDYRFYAADLAHPSDRAVEYIWEKFSAAAFGTETRKLLAEIENIVRATEHRPFNPDTGEHAAFRRKMLEEVRRFAGEHPEIDLSAEIRFFGGTD